MKTYTVEIYDADEISTVDNIIAPGAATAAYEAMGDIPAHFFNGATFRVWETGNSKEQFFKMTETKLVACKHMPEHELSM